MVTRVNILVEGQTEETFVRTVLAEPLGRRGVFVSARSIQTGHHRGVIHRGGMTTFAKAERDIRRWLAEDRSALLTTMFDLYHLPGDFPGVDRIRRFRRPDRKVETVENALAATIGDRRFIPYIQLHEFEGLLFSDVTAIDLVLRPYVQRSKLDELQEIRASFRTPEEIDDGDKTAPSKRLLALYPAYDKVALGSLIAGRIGLEIMRNECPHFANWLTKIEARAENA